MKKKPHLYIFISFGEIMICWWAQWSIFFWTYSQHCRYFRLQNLEAFNFCQAIVLAKIESYVSLIGLKFIPKKLWIMSIILLKIQIHSVWWPSLKDKQSFLFITWCCLLIAIFSVLAFINSFELFPSWCCNFSWIRPSHDLETERTANATNTLNLLLNSHDKRLRPKFGGKILKGELQLSEFDFLSHLSCLEWR